MVQFNKENPLNILKYCWLDNSFQEYINISIALLGPLSSSCATLWKGWWPEALPDLWVRNATCKGNLVS